MRENSDIRILKFFVSISHKHGHPMLMKMREQLPNGGGSHTYYGCKKKEHSSYNKSNLADIQTRNVCPNVEVLIEE